MPPRPWARRWRQARSPVRSAAALPSPAARVGAYRAGAAGTGAAAACRGRRRECRQERARPPLPVRFAAPRRVPARSVSTPAAGRHWRGSAAERTRRRRQHRASRPGPARMRRRAERQRTASPQPPMRSAPAIIRAAAPPSISPKEIAMFKRPSVRYGATPEPETPYQSAGQVWDERIGSARVQAKNWRLAFFGMLLLSGGLAGGLVWQSARGTVTPWVVQVDKLGQAQAVAPAVADYRPTDPQIAWHLARFIEEVREHPGRSRRAAPELARRLRLRRPIRARWRSNDYARASDPFAKVGKTPGRGRGVERHPRLRRQLPRRLDRAPLRRRRARRDRALDRHPHHRRPDRRPTPSGCRRTRSASTSTPSTGPRSSADAPLSPSHTSCLASVSLGACSTTWKPPADQLRRHAAARPCSQPDPPKPVQIVELPQAPAAAGAAEAASRARKPHCRSPPIRARASSKPTARPASSRRAPATSTPSRSIRFRMARSIRSTPRPAKITDIALAAGRAARRLRPGRRRRHRALDHRRHRERDRHRPGASTSSSSRRGRISSPTSSSTPTGAPIISSCARPRRPTWRRSPGPIRRTS